MLIFILRLSEHLTIDMNVNVAAVTDALSVTGATDVIADEAAAESPGLMMTSNAMLIAELPNKVDVNEICEWILDPENEN